MPIIGFLYAFHTVPAHGPPDRYVEALVSILSRSLIVHVEMMPVYGTHEKLCVRASYTACMQHHFGCYPPQLLDERGTLLLYLPAESGPSAEAGARFLHSLLGVPYNYAGLPRTLFPERYRRAADPLHVPHTVFCSEAGLQLAYLCGAIELPHSFECSPAELYSLLSTVAEPVKRCQVHVLN